MTSIRLGPDRNPEKLCTRPGCKAYKLKDRDTCKSHSVTGIEKGFKYKNTKATFGTLIREINKVSADRMAFYAKRVGPKLKALIEQGIADYKTGDISEEIVLTREIVSNSLQLYEILLETEGLDPQAKQHALHHAGQAFINGADQVTRLHERQAKINALIGGKIMPDAIQKVTEQITRFVYECFDDRPEQVAEFDRKMSEELELPVLANSMNVGTKITPDMEALAMDATIPYYEDEPKEIED